MTKTFTWNEAQTLLPVLESLLKRAQTSAETASELESEMQALSHQIFLSGGMRVDIASAARRRADRDAAVQETRDTLAEIDSIGVQVADLEEGLLAFPCKLEGSVVLLSWQLGEPTITSWHGEDESFTERKPVDSRFGRIERERLN
ncbi:DUF2203 domain-containing protein [Granulicella sibirica]|uniref:DUF2203 domain-containing protein n=1 Tax=Granulicella sibirica TaxID=2479048 RepID=A0A4Q0T3W3_9BACT|nr:DUF2203 domain-containing protein [Granulicella sibirica]RXH56226.1 hypothetical protein GRAN_3083 [Granulicella sibirica]